MVMKIDLHVHSNCSDGKMSLEGIFEEARQRGISLLSITDHDSMEGLRRGPTASLSSAVFSTSMVSN